MTEKNKRDRITLDLTGLKERIEALRSDAAWKELSLSKKIRILLQERLTEIENQGGKYP